MSYGYRCFQTSPEMYRDLQMSPMFLYLQMSPGYTDFECHIDLEIYKYHLYSDFQAQL